ncbi:MAG: HEAT repeat domain-containing protein [Bacteroidota bacterium]|nr:HEAT repeat domain-containing protein [Bacteroidota bacterium]
MVLKKHIIIVLCLMVFYKFNYSQPVGCTNEDEIYEEPFWTKRTYVPPISVLWEYCELKENQKIEFLDISPDSLIKELEKLNLCYKRFSIVEKLGKINSNKQISTLENLLLNDTCTKVRIECAKALGRFNSHKSIPVLKKALSDSNIFVVLESALTLSESGEKEQCFQALVKIWKANIGQKYIVHTGLKNIGNDKAFEFLKYAAEDSIDATALDATIVLAQMGYIDFAREKLLEFLSNSNHLIRLAALYAVFKYFDDELKISLCNKLKNDKDRTVSEYAKKFLIKLNSN